MIDKKIILFGCGQEIFTVLTSLFGKVDIVAFGTDSSTLNSAQDSLEYCKEKNIPVLDCYTQIDLFEPDFVFMISYPPLILEKYIEKHTFINVHNTLLPKYRGFHGPTWALINGEKKHGYTVHAVDSGIDSGPIYFQESFEITNNDDINSLRIKCFDLYKKSIVNVLLEVFEGKRTAQPQDDNEAIYVTKRGPADSLINWSWDSELIFNHIRALTPPYTDGAFTYFKGEKIYITKAQLMNMPNYFSIPGKVLAKLEKGVLVKTGTNPILINEICVNGEYINPASFFKTVGITLKNK